MKPIRSHNVEFNPTDLILRSHAKQGVSKDGRCGTALSATVLRDARESALLRTRLINDIDMIRTSETVYWTCSIEVDGPAVERAATSPAMTVSREWNYFCKASTATICMRAELSNWFTVGRPVLGSSNACPGL
jgi:hypothetical protein